MSIHYDPINEKDKPWRNISECDTCGIDLYECNVVLSNGERVCLQYIEQMPYYWSTSCFCDEECLNNWREKHDI